MVPEISIPRLYFMIMEKSDSTRLSKCAFITCIVGTLAYGSDAQLPFS
jgi:hypothetical protein